MCCREGVDKRPKPPKAVASTKAPIKKNQAESKVKTTKSLATISSKPIIKKPAKGIRPYKIDVVDLSSAKPRDDYAKFGPKTHKSLDQLHRSTVSANPARVIASKRSTPFAMGCQTQISFLEKAAGSADNAGKKSSDCGDDRIDDLPSPSTLFRNRRSKTSPNPAMSPKFDEDVSELEAGMVDLGDPMVFEGLYRDPPEECYPSHSQSASTTYQHKETYDQELDSLTSHLDDYPQLSSLPTENADASRTFAKDDHLFIHTSSPEKVLRGIHCRHDSREMTRPSMDYSRVDSCNHAPPMKKRKLATETHSDQALQPRDTMDCQKPYVASNEKPLWMDGIDPELLAEFGDIVDFY